MLSTMIANRVKMSRVWDMPSADTLSIPAIKSFALRYLNQCRVSVDPFARNCRAATITNDLNPETSAQHHLDVVEFFDLLRRDGVKPDLFIFDPPYSPRQVMECYQAVGRPVSASDTQNGALYAKVRAAMNQLIVPGGVVLSFGWNSTGMGKDGWKIEEILLVAHGGAHNDTICMAERKLTEEPTLDFASSPLT